MVAFDPQASESSPRLTRLSDLLTAWEAEAAAAYEARVSERPRGPVTGVRSLDAELGGVLTPGLHLIHGSPGVGKTALLTQVATSCGFPALLVTCEMAPLEIFRRHAARVTSTPLGRLKSGEIALDASLELAREAAEAAPWLTIVDATQAFASPEWLRQAAGVTRENKESVLVAVDSIHSWCDGAPAVDSEYERLSAAIAALRALAGVLRCPVLAIAERNRASMQSGGLSAGAGSRKLEYAAETVWELQRDPAVPPDAAGEVPVALRLVKNRNGAAAGAIRLKFSGAFQRFREA